VPFSVRSLPGITRHRNRISRTSSRGVLVAAGSELEKQAAAIPRKRRFE